MRVGGCPLIHIEMLQINIVGWYTENLMLVIYVVMDEDLDIASRPGYGQHLWRMI